MTPDTPAFHLDEDEAQKPTADEPWSEAEDAIIASVSPPSLFDTSDTLELTRYSSLAVSQPPTPTPAYRLSTRLPPSASSS